MNSWSTSGSFSLLQFWVPVELAGPSASEYHAAVVVWNGLAVRVTRAMSYESAAAAVSIPANPSTGTVTTAIPAWRRSALISVATWSIHGLPDSTAILTTSCFPVSST